MQVTAIAHKYKMSNRWNVAKLFTEIYKIPRRNMQKAEKSKL